MKKLEIIIDKTFLPKIIEFFDASDIEGYSIIEVWKGKGEAHDETYVSGSVFSSKNVYIISLCPPGKALDLQIKISGMITEVGGLITVSTPDFFYVK